MLDKTAHANRVWLTPSPWTEEDEAKLAQDWELGFTAGQISARFDGRFSRSAVLGKVHRLQLASRASRPLSLEELNNRRIRRNQAKYEWKKRTGYKPPKRAFLEPEPIVESEIPLEQRRQLLELTDETCRWPIGHPGVSDFFFCGATPKAGKSYCAHHCRVAYDQLRSRPSIGPFIQKSWQAA